MKAVQAALVAATAFGVMIAAPVIAQTYPTLPIHVTVPFPPGAMDVFPRFVQPGMEKELGQPLIIEARAGANGSIGNEFVARSAPDGYNLLFNTTSSLVMASDRHLTSHHFMSKLSAIQRIVGD